MVGECEELKSAIELVGEKQLDSGHLQYQAGQLEGMERGWLGVSKYKE